MITGDTGVHTQGSTGVSVNYSSTKFDLQGGEVHIFPFINNRINGQLPTSGYCCYLLIEIVATATSSTNL